MTRRQRNLFAGLICLTVSVVFGIHEFGKQKVRDATDISTINGHLSSFSFQDRARGHHHYVIRLLEFPATFQIPADFLGSFSKNRFQSDLDIGDFISISISKGDEKSLTTNKRLFVFSVRSKTATYLDEQETIRRYNN